MNVLPTAVASVFVSSRARTPEQGAATKSDWSCATRSSRL